jgi:ribosome biogenesis GTPase
MIHTGLVLKSTGSWYSVVDDKGRVFDCRLRGQYRIHGIRSTNPVAVGDIVDFVPEDDETKAVIMNIHERRNFIIRKSIRLSKASHIIAANIDLAVLVATLDQPRTSTGFIDRFLATAEAYHIPAAVIFNKYDLCDPLQQERTGTYVQVYRNIGYSAMAISAITGHHIQEFRELIKNKVTLISGHSGVGKSALINAVDPAFGLRIGDISSFNNKGKHTTTYAEMFPLSGGGYIVDTPGIKEFGLYDFDRETLAQRFPEMRSRMSECHFANCTHIHEPGCAVKDAVDKAEIAPFRYRNYLNMMEDDFTTEE